MIFLKTVSALAFAILFAGFLSAVAPYVSLRSSSSLGQSCDSLLFATPQPTASAQPSSDAYTQCLTKASNTASDSQSKAVAFAGVRDVIVLVVLVALAAAVGRRYPFLGGAFIASAIFYLNPGLSAVGGANSFGLTGTGNATTLIIALIEAAVLGFVHIRYFEKEDTSA